MTTLPSQLLHGERGGASCKKGTRERERDVAARFFELTMWENDPFVADKLPAVAGWLGG